MAPLDLNITSLAMVLLAGLASVASPCVLPVIPIIVTGTKEDHRHRPVLIVLGLSASFIAMGAISSLFGGAVAGVMPLLEKGAGCVIILFGMLMLFDINPFKRLTAFSQIRTESRGRWSGLILGSTLGLVWIPCVGPMLSGVLALVATEGRLSMGLVLLAVYSLGFALPMLAAGYATQSMRQKIRAVNRYPIAIRVASSLLLIGFGLYILSAGMLPIGFSTS